MFGSNVLEVAIGLIFVYLLLSLFCTTINEQIIARFFTLRARTLRDGITTMFATSSQRDELVKQVYESPLIRGLSQQVRSGKVQDPSYIPADTFALALMNTPLMQTYKANPNAGENPLPAALVSLLKSASNDPADEQVIIEKWFNDTMDRASGWYKRKIQLIIFFLGLGITIALNVDTLSLITGLSNQATTRAAIVSAAQGYTNAQAKPDLTALESNIQQFQPVIGWSSLPGDLWGWILKVVGLLATALAISLGAPFWFDILNKFVSFRSSGPPVRTS